MNDPITKAGHEKAKRIIKQFEGLRLKAYRDVAGLPTIGWGSTHYLDGEPVRMGDEITAEFAERLLNNDMRKFEQGIRAHVPIDLNDNQDAALISFAYNLGLGALYHSTLLKYLKQGNLTRAADEFPKWCHAGGEVVDGLVKRRRKERELFLA